MLYKLTDKDGRTYGGCQWGEGIEHTATGNGKLCTAGWLHAYTDLLVAVLMDPIHGAFGEDAQMWEADGDVGKTASDGKVGCTRLRTLRQVPLPVVTRGHRIRFGILCAMRFYRHEGFQKWAREWLAGINRTKAAAWAAWAAARAAAGAAAWAAAGAAAWAAEAAAWAAEAAARAAARAAEAAEAGASLDLVALAHEAIEKGAEG